MSNIDVFNECLLNPENVIDEYYFTDLDNLFIDNKEIISKISKLRQYLTTCSINIEKWQSNQYILDDILHLLENNTQYSEFVSFWKVLDVSYSVFVSLKVDLQKKLLLKFIDYYSKYRENNYVSKWLVYSDTTIQALYDAWSSRSKWQMGQNKIISYLKKHWIEDFVVSETAIYTNIIEMKLNFDFNKTHQWKLPDALFSINWHIFILEAKHINEWWWAQDKQLWELIDFIKQSENIENIHYISFLDWTYFNKFIMPKKTSSKINSQKNDIINLLNKNPWNFFVNTYWFEKMLDYFTGN